MEIPRCCSISIQSDLPPGRSAGLDRAGGLDGTAVEQELLGQRGLPGVGVRDDGEGAAALGLCSDEFGLGVRGQLSPSPLMRIRSVNIHQGGGSGRDPAIQTIQAGRPGGSSTRKHSAAIGLRPHVTQEHRAAEDRDQYQQHEKHQSDRFGFRQAEDQGYRGRRRTAALLIRSPSASPFVDEKPPRRQPRR